MLRLLLRAWPPRPAARPPASVRPIRGPPLPTAADPAMEPSEAAAAEPSAGQNGARCSELDGEAPESTDYANYFCTYSFIYHQKDMLEDHKRTGSYFNAVMRNRGAFEGRVVLDVGTGSGILAIFAARAGARKVYAVEATSMAKFARELAIGNKCEDVIEVIQGTIETVTLPEKVDIIISEWMGYFLLRESMLDSVLVARDKFLKPDGALYPSHARMYFSPIESPGASAWQGEYQGAMEGWHSFLHAMSSLYDVDLGCLTNEFNKEQADYYLQTAQWTDVHPAQMLGPPVCFKEYDLLTVTLEELKKPVSAAFTLDVVAGGPVEALAGFFDVEFRGSPTNPADHPVRLSTAPDMAGSTHWGQLSFFIHPPIDCGQGDKLRCRVCITRKQENHRLMNVSLHCDVLDPSDMPTGVPSRDLTFQIE
ncbi:unnamed protein product [Ostreobium quekettii]|uniref:Protein arginine N-methyltransferase domain-containing protein n=1 Tax=Ostreobium quekettii TaxID=121088 RepID=A0A8S1J0B4_9CHLO|nr:unnamed protein product [Ostreobium quekettii]